MGTEISGGFVALCCFFGTLILIPCFPLKTLAGAALCIGLD
jgi:hypothetical protein